MVSQGLAALNAGLVALTDAWLVPLASWPPLLALFVLSVLTALVMLPVVRRTSDQARIRATKRRIQAALFEIRLFSEEPRFVLRALGDALAANLLYLRLSLVPLAWLALPLLLLMAHLEAFYGRTGLTMGTPALVELQLRGDPAEWPPATAVSLEAPEALRVETTAVRFPASGEIVWRLVPEQAGDFALTLRVAGHVIVKSLHVSHDPARRSPRRALPGVVDQLLFPSEPPLPADAPVSHVDVAYPEARISVWGWDLDWLVIYIAMTLVVALVLAPRWGVVL